MNNLKSSMKLFVIALIVALTAIQAGPTETAAAQSQPTQRVQFARGATQATLEGTLTAGGDILYLLRASKGQRMWIYVDQFNWDNDLTGTLIAPSGYPTGNQAFEGGMILAEGGEYEILVQSTTGAEYAITVGIENQQSTPAQPEEPVGIDNIQFERINFRPGATSAVRHGTVGMNGTVLYTLSAAEGQQMDVTLSGNPNVALALRGPRTMPLEGGSQQKWSGRLPGTGTYEIAVYSTLGAFEKNFKLHVSIVTPTQPAPQPEEPVGIDNIQFERINFRPGATSAVRHGTVGMNGTVLYTLSAAEGQQMDVTLSGDPNVALSLRGPRTMPLEGGSQQAWSGRLPGTGTYEIAVYSTLGAFNKNFKLHVSIVTPKVEPQPVQEQVKRVYFQRGATSAIRYGKVGMNESITYILGAGAGQQMNVTVSGSSQVGMEVYSPSGDYLFSFEPRNWSGTLPESGDYRIKVASAAGVYDKNFKVSFSIR